MLCGHQDFDSSAPDSGMEISIAMVAVGVFVVVLDCVVDESIAVDDVEIVVVVASGDIELLTAVAVENFATVVVGVGIVVGIGIAVLDFVGDYYYCHC